MDQISLSARKATTCAFSIVLAADNSETYVTACPVIAFAGNFCWWIFNNYSPKWRWLAVDIYRAANKHQKQINLDDFFTFHGCKPDAIFSRVARR